MSELTVPTEWIECCNCNMIFGVTKRTKEKFKSSGETFYCPQGHSQHYTKTHAEEMADVKAKYERKVSELNDRLGNAWKKAVELHEELRIVSSGEKTSVYKIMKPPTASKLNSNGLKYVEDLGDITYDKLIEIHGIGDTKAREILEAIKQFNPH